jgi:hypothetical protein
MEYWSIGVLEYWSTGVLEYWDGVVLGAEDEETPDRGGRFGNSSRSVARSARKNVALAFTLGNPELTLKRSAKYRENGL